MERVWGTEEFRRQKKKKYRNEIWRDKGRKYALEKEKGIKIEKNNVRGNEKERRGIGKEKRKKGEKTRSWNSFNRLIILFKAVVSLSVLLSVAFWCNQPLFGRIMNSLWKKEEKRRSKRSSPFASEEPDSSFCKIKRSLHCWMLSHTPARQSTLFENSRYVERSILRLEDRGRIHIFDLHDIWIE